MFRGLDNLFSALAHSLSKAIIEQIHFFSVIRFNESHDNLQLHTKLYPNSKTPRFSVYFYVEISNWNEQKQTTVTAVYRAALALGSVVDISSVNVLTSLTSCFIRLG